MRNLTGFDVSLPRSLFSIGGRQDHVAFGEMKSQIDTYGNIFEPRENLLCLVFLAPRRFDSLLYFFIS